MCGAVIVTRAYLRERLQRDYIAHVHQVDEPEPVPAPVFEKPTTETAAMLKDVLARAKKQ